MKALSGNLAASDGAHDLAAQVRLTLDGRPDIFVSNAAISNEAIIEKQTDEEFDRIFVVNVRAPYFLVQQLLPTLSGDASLILVSSMGARMAFGGRSAYGASKGARKGRSVRDAGAPADRPATRHRRRGRIPGIGCRALDNRGLDTG